MGLGLVYGTIGLRPGDEVVPTTHDFYSTHESLRLRAAQTGARVRRIRLYARPERATADEILSSVRRGIGSRTRVLALAWVHSSRYVRFGPSMANSKREVDRVARAVASLR